MDDSLISEEICFSTHFPAGTSSTLNCSFDAGWLDSGWWDEAMSVCLTASDKVQGLALLVSVACELATSSESYRPAGLRLPRPPVKMVCILTSQLGVAMRMVEAWSNQHFVALGSDHQDYLKLDEKQRRVFDAFKGCSGGQSNFNPIDGSYYFEGVDGKIVIVAPTDYKSPKSSVVLILESEARIDSWEFVQWNLKGNGTPGLLTLCATKSLAFVQCKMRTVNDTKGGKTLAVSALRNNVAADVLSPHKARKAFYGSVIGKMIQILYPNLTRRKRIKLVDILGRYCAWDIARFEVHRNPGQWRRVPRWPGSSLAQDIRRQNPHTLGKVSDRVPNPKHLVDTLRKHRLHHRWLDAEEGWSFIVLKPRPRCGTTIIVSPPPKNPL